MSINLRCPKCNRYFAISHRSCPTCGHESRTKQYHIRYDGKAVFAGNSLKIAREMESKMKQDKRLGRILEYSVQKDMPFCEFVSQYYEPHYQAKKSAQSIQTKVKCFLSVFADRPLRTITPSDVEKAVSAKYVGVSARTRDYYLAIIRRIFNYAVELEVIEKSPVKMKELKVDNARHRYLNDGEVKRLLNECAKSKSPYLYPMVILALHTGMRIGEIRSLKAADIVDGKIYIKSVHTKNSRSKIIPINESLRSYLDSYLVAHSEFDFAHDVGIAFNSCVKLAGIKDFRFHDLRHTFASFMVGDTPFVNVIIERLLRKPCIFSGFINRQ
jgi:integrase/ribosomal protein L32